MIIFKRFVFKITKLPETRRLHAFLFPDIHTGYEVCHKLVQIVKPSVLRLFDEAETGYIDKEDFLLKFEAFINNKTLFGDYPPIFPKENLFKRLLRKIHGK